MILSAFVSNLLGTRQMAGFRVFLFYILLIIRIDSFIITGTIITTCFFAVIKTIQNNSADICFNAFKFFNSFEKYTPVGFSVFGYKKSHTCVFKKRGRITYDTKRWCVKNDDVKYILHFFQELPELFTAHNTFGTIGSRAG